MPELRRDPIVGRWVIIATERARRPNQFRRAEDPPGGLCPFCPGHEDKTPAEVYVSGRPAVPANVPGWKVRVVPNRYPALMIEGDLDREAVGIYDRMNGVGAHEVVIETPEHSRDLSELTDAEVTEVLFAFKARVLDLQERPALPLHPALQEPRLGGRGHARAHPQPAHRAAGDAAPGGRRDRRRAAPPRAPGALHLLRHRRAGAQGPLPAGLRERGVRGLRALGAAQPLRDLDRARAATSPTSRPSPRSGSPSRPRRCGSRSRSS